MYLIRFGKWFLIEGPVNWIRAAKNLRAYILEMFGVKAHREMFMRAMFHDETFVGYLLTIIFRIIFISSGYLLANLIWLVMLVGLGWWWLGWGLVMRWELVLVWLTVVIVSFMVRVVSGRAWGQVSGAYTWEKLMEIGDDNERELVKAFPNLGEWWKNGSVNWWMLRMGLWGNDLPLATNFDKDEWGALVWKMVGSRQEKLHSGHMLLALFEKDEVMQGIMRQKYVEMGDILGVLDWNRREKDWWENYPIWHENYEMGVMAGFNRGMTGVKTKVLDQYSIDLTAMATNLPESLCKEDKYLEMFGVLARSKGENIMLIGEEGVGKSTFVGGIAKMIMRGNAPNMIRNRRLVKLEIGRLLAGGQAAAKLVGLLDDIKRSSDIILFIDDIHTLMSREAMGSGMNLFSIIQEASSNSRMQLIGATNAKNFKRFIEPVESFAKMFSVVRIEEPDDEKAMIILQNMVHELEMSHGVIYAYSALRDVILLSRRYLLEGVLPDKAKSILDEAGARAKMAGSYYVDSELIRDLITQKSGVPVHKVGGDEKQKLLELESEIHKEFVGQEIAVQAVADALRRARLDVRNERRPIGSFMFVGPTGVGKTELSRQLARVYFGSEAAMIRFDMTEFSQITMINRLIGSPVGTSGHEQGGELTEKVRRQPFCLILLDELEKAHPKVWDLLLQVMEDGHLTDASGMKVDFSHTILIATSNAVTAYIQQQLLAGRNLADMRQDMIRELGNTFRLEFINRFDGIVPFGPLEKFQLMEVANLELNKLKSRLAGKEIILNWTQGLVEIMARDAIKENLGARPIRRFIQDRIESKIAKLLLTVDDVRGMEINLDENFL